MTTSNTLTKSDLIIKIKELTDARPGLEPRAYGDNKSYRRELKTINDHKQFVRTLLDAIEEDDSITVDNIRGCFAGTRVKLDGDNLRYVTGGYEATEIRGTFGECLANIFSGRWAKEAGERAESRPYDNARIEARRHFGLPMARAFFDYANLPRSRR